MSDQNTTDALIRHHISHRMRRPRHDNEAITLIRASVPDSAAIERQRRDCNAIVEELFGTSTNVKECDLSNSTFGELIEEIERRPPRAIVSVDPTRVTRDPSEFDRFLDACDRHGVHLEFVESPLLITIP